MEHLQRESKIPLYIQLARIIRTNILSKKYENGEKLSQRKIAEKYNVSKKTVSDAFDILVSEGLLIAKEKSGNIVNYDNTLHNFDDFSDTWFSILDKAYFLPNHNDIYNVISLMSSDTKVRLSGIAVHNDFGYSLMIEKVMKNIYNKIADNKVFNNIDTQGLYSCREEIAHHVEKYGIKCSPENIVITTNPMEAVSIVLHSFARFGMKYYQECPCILNSCTFAHTYGLNLENVPLENDGLDVNYFLKALHKNKNNQGILYLSPVNQYPTGFSTSKYKRDAILSACIKNNVAIIENDILRDFYITKKHPKPLKSFDKQGQVIYIGSFLNAWTNIGVGYIIAEPIVIRKVNDTKAQNTIMTSTINQIIVEEMLKSGFYDEYLEISRKIFKERLYAFNMLLEKYFSGIAEWNNNPNIFFQYLKFKKPVNTFDTIKELSNIAVHSSYFFDKTSVSEIYLNPFIDTLENIEYGLSEISKKIKSKYDL